VLLIAGPTASGKSALAVEIARRVDGEVVNADSMQVYADLCILSARPLDAETASVPHHLFGHVDAAERYSVGRWLDEALGAIADIRARGRTPVLAGGTGLYFRALTRGLAAVPDPGAEAKGRAQAVFDAGGIDALTAEAARLDPEAAGRIAPNDRQRLMRAVAVAYGTDRTLSAWQAEGHGGDQPEIGAWRGAALALEPKALNARIAARLRVMAEMGGLEEAARLEARGLDADLPAMKALGVAEFAAASRGEMDLDEAIERATIATRRYAKRQRTWIRNQMADWLQVNPQGPGAAAALAGALGL